ncbi:MAG: adenylosuccinate synthase [Candidatus Thorarchaeota archaeon]
MNNLVVVGLQWGDEGKGKIVDFVGEAYDIVARFQGGSNAGHTVVTREREYKFRIMPTGAVRGKTAVIGNGVVVDPEVLLDEISALKSLGVDVDLVLSERAHIVTPLHIQLDGLREAARRGSKIGTTKRGIGPTYADKVARVGVRICDVLSPSFERYWSHFARTMRSRIERLYETSPIDDLDRLRDRVKNSVAELKPYVSDSGDYLRQAINDGKSILFEGAQGTLLDIDHGTYPYVTSSNCIAGAAATGTGVPPSALHGVLGVTKAYTTRVGAGPFPTEVSGTVGQRIQERGGEFGTVTGRPRRCGWLDLVALEYAASVNGTDALALTKIDVLAGTPTVSVCVAYEIDGTETTRFPASTEVLSNAEAVLEEVPGWEDVDIGTRGSAEMEIENLPGNMREYLAIIEERIGVPIVLVSVGPGRDETATNSELLGTLTGV